VSKNNVLVNLSSFALLQIFYETSRAFPKETGGILLGSKGKRQIWVEKIIGPGPNAVHENSSFAPDNDFHIEQISKIYRETSGCITYLGDWHSHPNNLAFLSERDKKTIRSISSFKDAQLPNPLMLIIGTKPLDIKAWIYQPKSLLENPYKEVLLLLNNDH